MKLVRISGPSSKLDKIISACCAMGDFHPEDASAYVSDTMGYTALSGENPYSAVLQSIRELADNYGFDLTEKSKLKKIRIDEAASGYINELTVKLRDLQQNEAQLTSQLDECSEAIEKFSHFVGLGISFDDIFSCKFIAAKFGHLSKEGYIKLQKAYGDYPYILFCPCSSDADGYWGAYFAPRDRSGEVDRIFAALQFQRLYIPAAVGTADEIIAQLRQNIAIIESQKADVANSIQSILSTEGDRIRAMYTRLNDLESIATIKRYAVFHGESCFFVGWIPAVDENRFVTKMSKYSDFLVEIDDPDRDGRVSPPTNLKNWRIFRPYEYYVKMYGVPSYRDIDVTSFVAVTYTLLFGIMFGDLGQGIVLSIVGFILWKVKKMDLGKILVPCGMASAFFGLMFGSVFGFEEALDPLYHAVGLKAKPLSVMDSINTVLLFAVGIGIAMVFLAMCINVVTCVKRKKFGSAFFYENGVTGIFVYLGGVSLVYSFMAHRQLLPGPVAASMMVVGIIILFCKPIIAESIDEGKFQKIDSVGDFILQNLFECIEYILSYFSNTVSFLRVGAFVIVHASMMMVVFTLAGDTSSVKGIIVVILGNIVVIALEGLLTGIQGLRLEFYEMFSRFYEGDGRVFEPVRSASAEK